ncbi:polysaccharide deacetylase family protein [Massilia sp. G4R7]|uniref:Polysaccharide deacetylase family protein n=1 Tax=Massilia phyllostachyos TaxID=2898585 RepID=A0ABS8QCD5_9BURK|nr:polysaccharide deacetylase family protein [Massilia phyllostachyos]MCD2519389.1 polysaccharide deacetylase family protein [Massilia phyllostachyos]
MRQTRQVSPLTRGTIRMLGTLLATGPAANRCCIINYHRVLPVHHPLLASEPDVVTFEWQMEVLARCFHVLPLREAVARLEAGKRLPPRAVCITFDDGYRSIHDLALPVLRRFGLPATVFVTSGHVDKGNMWNDRIIEAVRMLPDGPLDLRDLGLGAYSLRSLDDRMAAIGVLTERSKYLPPPERSSVIERLSTLAGDTMTPELMLTRDMLLNLDRHGIEIGAHTVTHPILTSLDDSAARSEIVAGKQQLEAILGKPVRLFAYPNGKVGMDFDQRHVAMVREAGFDAAFTTAVGAITPEQDRFQLPRSRPWDRNPLMFGLRLLRWLVQGGPDAG